MNRRMGTDERLNNKKLSRHYAKWIRPSSGRATAKQFDLGSSKISFINQQRRLAADH
jgi:hypothetical protein